MKPIPMAGGRADTKGTSCEIRYVESITMADGGAEIQQTMFLQQAIWGYGS